MIEILRVFTKEYRKETKYYEYLKKHKDKIKLKCGDLETIDEKISRLKNL